MDFIPVVSSNIAAVGYDAIQNILHIQFIGKETTYKYYGVPVETFDEMMAAPSVGSFYARRIKKNFRSQEDPERGNASESDSHNQS
ncbi:KTSC domain-containing protein [Paenibacillus sp. 2RAB27]|uniref:KTSC domain-containing protein n=1 Tax=Paenibacillus sp. 2RAB27 TaxID=3232991 RepID=UPI003F9C76CA